MIIDKFIIPHGNPVKLGRPYYKLGRLEDSANNSVMPTVATMKTGGVVCSVCGSGECARCVGDSKYKLPVVTLLKDLKI